MVRTFGFAAAAGVAALAAAAVMATGSAAAPAPTALTFVPGSTVKLEQLIGDTDNQRHAPTANQTDSRYGILGTDLGYSFEHEGKAYFLFGDTIGGRGGDPIGVTSATDPAKGVHLDFLTDATGKYLKLAPPGVDMGPFNVPVSGISLNGKMYVVVKTGHSADDAHPTDRSILTRYDGKTGFTVLRTLSTLPGGKVIKMSLHVAPPGAAGLPAGGPYVLVWSSGVYRLSDAYMSIVPEASFETGKGTRYFAGFDAKQAPTWSDREADARPIVTNGTIGDLSVTWAAAAGLWLMTYDSRAAGLRGIVFQYSATPWGPWSAPQVLFDPVTYTPPFIHAPRRGDDLAGPVTTNADPETIAGGSYAPYVIERFTSTGQGKLTITYTCPRGIRTRSS